MEVQEGQSAAPDELQAEELQKKIDELTRQNSNLSSSVTKLEAKRDEVLTELKKKKRIDALLRAAGIDPDDEEAEEEFTQRIAGVVVGTKDPGPDTAGSSAGTVPSTSVRPEDLETKAQLKMMQKKLAQMEDKVKEAEIKEQQAIEKRKNDYIEIKVKEALTKRRCINANHLFKLQGAIFRLSDDGETIIGGPEHDPRSLEDQIEALVDDPEFAPYFMGSGASGSGMSKGNNGFGGQSLKNPFRTDQLNITEAAGIYQKDPEKAKRLILEARNAGKLEPSLGKLVNA
jgi:hypothetical protein